MAENQEAVLMPIDQNLPALEDRGAVQPPVIRDTSLFGENGSRHRNSSLLLELRISQQNFLSLLVREVIRREKDHKLRKLNANDDRVLDKFVISTDRFKILAEEIVQIFPTENVASYFQSYQKCKKRSILASGKLWNHYNYVKGCLRSKGLLKNQHQELVQSLLFPPEGKKHLFIFISTFYIKCRVGGLSSNVDPWQRVTEAWELTFGLRRALYLTNKDFTIQEYFKQFKCLSMQDAKELLLSDFQVLYSNEYTGDTEWTRIKRILISALDDAPVKNPAEAVKILLLQSGELNGDEPEVTLSDDTSDLFPNSTIKADLKDSCLKFTPKLYEMKNISRKHINSVVNETNDFLKEITEILK
uniref:Uncharacterized protein n=1 Tax=Trichogramma kaykai TaxID=54128 RepID=A0ABD2WCC0_9HYME